MFRVVWLDYYHFPPSQVTCRSSTFGRDTVLRQRTLRIPFVSYLSIVVPRFGRRLRFGINHGEPEGLATSRHGRCGYQHSRRWRYTAASP